MFVSLTKSRVGVFALREVTCPLQRGNMFDFSMCIVLLGEGSQPMRSCRAAGGKHFGEPYFSTAARISGTAVTGPKTYASPRTEHTHIPNASHTHSDLAMRGSIKFFAQDKGFGFILPDDASGDVFFHHTALANAGKRPTTISLSFLRDSLAPRVRVSRCSTILLQR